MNRRIDVTLTWSEVLSAAILAVRKETQNLCRGLKDEHGANSKKDGWQIQIEGSFGEVALAKHVDRYWSGCVGDYKAADVGPYQVRTRKFYRDPMMPLHPKDADDEIFVLVMITELPNLQICGWLVARDGKREEFWGDRFNTNRPAYWVPESELHPMEELPKK